MLFLRTIVAALLSPLIWFSNLFKRKDNILEWHLNFGRSTIHIDIAAPRPPTEALFICAYLLFVGRYFMICDDRQEDAVRKALKEDLKKGVDSKTIPLHLYESASATFAAGEREATRQLFTMGLPPMTFALGGEPVHSLAKYSFLVLVRHGELYGNFHMSFGPDIVLLPVALGILYDFVASTVTGRNKTLLSNGVIALLEMQEERGARSVLQMHQQPMEVINSLHLE